MEIFSGIAVAGTVAAQVGGIAAAYAAIESFNQKPKGVNNTMQRPKVTALLVAIAALVNTSSTEGDQVAAKKQEVNKALDELDAKDDPALVDAVNDLTDLAVAVNPPAKADVESAAKIGARIGEQPQRSEGKKAEDRARR